MKYGILNKETKNLGKKIKADVGTDLVKTRKNTGRKALIFLLIINASSYLRICVLIKDMKSFYRGV